MALLTNVYPNYDYNKLNDFKQTQYSKVCPFCKSSNTIGKTYDGGSIRDCNNCGYKGFKASMTVGIMEPKTKNKTCNKPECYNFENKTGHLFSRLTRYKFCDNCNIKQKGYDRKKYDKKKYGGDETIGRISSTVNDTCERCGYTEKYHDSNSQYSMMHPFKSSRLRQFIQNIENNRPKGELMKDYKYDYKNCPYCGANDCFAMINDGGSSGYCNKCSKDFISKIIKLKDGKQICNDITCYNYGNPLAEHIRSRTFGKSYCNKCHDNARNVSDRKMEEKGYKKIEKIMKIPGDINSPYKYYTFEKI